MHTKEFDDKFCSQLNAQQLEAVHCTEGPVLLLAVPGSGKTTVLVKRLGYMVKCKKIHPLNILTMTYTVAATREMRQRFSLSFGEDTARLMEFCTINSLAAQIINHYVQIYGSGKAFPLIENEAVTKLIASIYLEINNEYPSESIIKDVRTAITYIKNMMVNREEIKNTDLGVDNIDKLYAAYTASLKKNGLMDFDDQLSYSLTILKRYPDVLDHFQNRFPYICVDEAQDTSKIQHEIIKLLSAKYRNLFMVGDEDQSIYGFRAAWPEALLNFEQDYPDGKLLLMEENFRSSKEICTAANEFISQNEHRHCKKIKAAREGIRPPQIIYAENRSVQYAYLCEFAKNCSNDTAILYRNNDSVLPLINMLEQAHISYNCKRFEDSFFTHRIVTDIKDTICFSKDPRNEDLFMRIYYKFCSPISRRAAEFACEPGKRSNKKILEQLLRYPELSEYARENIKEFDDMLSIIPNLSAKHAIIHIWKTMKYSAYAAKNGLDAGKFDILCELAEKDKTPTDFIHHLDRLRETILQHENKSENKLMLSTVHSSKGLEYEQVYLMDMFDGILPSKRKNELKLDEDFRHHEEDRRIYYVAMTRARNGLYFFECEDKTGEFNSEIAAKLPHEIINEQEIFSPLRRKLCGKIYFHKEKGQGTIKAQCGDSLLVYYDSHGYELKNLAQLMAERDSCKEYSYKPVEAQNNIDNITEQDFVFSIGSRVIHTVFGHGTILAIKGDTASIMFSEEHGIKRIVLSSSLKKGIIIPEP